MTDHETNTATKIPRAELDRLAREAGMLSVLPDGDGAFVWSAGCNGVLAEHLERFAELAAARALAAPAAQGATQEPVAYVMSVYALAWAGSGPIAPIVEKHGLKVGSPLYAAPVGQAEDAARWQPIETAPKDKTVLVWSEGCGTWTAVCEKWRPYENGEEVYAWRALGLGILDTPATEPRYWMPLPPPPSAQQAGQAETGEPT